MRKKVLSIWVVLLPLYLFISCQVFESYPSYEEVVEQRSKIKAIIFEKEKWFDKEGIGVEALWDKRPGLARDLINRRLLIGKSFDEVKELLGEQEKYDDTVSYETFVKPGVADPIYSESLMIFFDKNNKVKSAEIRIGMHDRHPDYR